MMIEIMGQAPQVYADNIFDLQFQYKLKNGLTVDVPPIAENVREVLIELSARSETPHAEGADDAGRVYRERTYNTSVFLRNIGI